MNTQLFYDLGTKSLSHNIPPTEVEFLQGFEYTPKLVDAYGKVDGLLNLGYGIYHNVFRLVGSQEFRFEDVKIIDYSVGEFYFKTNYDKWFKIKNKKATRTLSRVGSLSNFCGGTMFWVPIEEKGFTVDVEIDINLEDNEFFENGELIQDIYCTQELRWVYIYEESDFSCRVHDAQSLPEFMYTNYRFF